MWPEQTIRACKGRIADLGKWLSSFAICQKVSCSKKHIIDKNNDVKEETPHQVIDDFKPIGDIQCRGEMAFGLEKEQVFTVQIKGKIQTDEKGKLVSLKLQLDEYNDINNSCIPIYQKTDVESISNQKPFEYICELGKINDRQKEFKDWISVAKIKPDWISFSRKGNCRLRLTAQLLNCTNLNIYAQCQSHFEFYNRQLGYLDISENTERAKALAVTLAFALSAADGRMYKSEIEKINGWAFGTYRADKNKNAKKQLAKALKKTIRFFKKGQKVNINALCKELSQITETWQRHDILTFCLGVVETKGFISAGQIKILKELSKSFDIEQNQFRSMLERFAPVDTHQVKDTELILGLSSDQNREQQRELLNKEYRKWNSRVTNINPQIRSQAEQMLELITEARSKCLS